MRSVTLRDSFSANNTSGINSPSAQSSFDVFSYVTTEGDIIVESLNAIKSLTLFGIDGKMITKQQTNGVEKQYIASIRDCAVGVYLLHVETEQGTVIKKVVKPLNK